MRFNFRLFFYHLYHSFFKSDNTPGRLSLKRLSVLAFIFLVYPVWHLYLRLGYLLDKVLFPAYKDTEIREPIFVIGNFRSGTTFLHRLLLQDERFTCLKAGEIYFAPAVSHRRLLNGLKKVSRALGSPIRWVMDRFNQAIMEYSYMHKTGLDKYEEDSQLLFHIWSSYNLFAIFPFPRLAKQYIYYDQMASEGQKERDMRYYKEILKRHVYISGGKRYISKNPDFSPMVETLMEYFPDAKFINIVRPPIDMISSTINMWANHWKTFGTPREDYPLKEVLIEHAKHWYRYPHQRLKTLPQDRYAVVNFLDFVQNPKKEVEQIYQQFSIPMSEEYARILEEAKEESRNHKSRSYPLVEMGLEKEQVDQDFLDSLHEYQFNILDQEPEKI
jgi:hypothetical protein